MQLFSEIIYYKLHRHQHECVMTLISQIFVTEDIIKVAIFLHQLNNKRKLYLHSIANEQFLESEP